jgi:hypothetical protein
MLTPAQRTKFFQLARKAWATVSPDTPFDDWRKQIMIDAGYSPSVSQVDHVWGYENLMLRFAVLAYDDSAIGYWSACVERRLRWVLKGLATDLQYLQTTGVGEEYIAGIYAQAGMLPADFEDAPVQHLWCCLQILDTRIRSLCKRDGIALHLLPTAGPPWQFRGVRAARYAAFVALSADRARRDAGLPTDATAEPSGAPVRDVAATA